MCWNVRGLNAPNKQNEVKLKCNKESIGMVGLVENKIKVTKIDNVANMLFGGWNFLTNLEHHYNGRVWLTWRPDLFQINLVSSNAQAITCQVVHNALQATFLLTVVYAFNRRGERKALWNYLEIVSTENCGLLELPTKGSRYTWSDKQGNDRIFSKIDWVFVNTDWLNNMPAFSAQVLPEGISDHCPVKIAPLDDPRRVRQPFQYCNVWSSHPSFLDNVNEGWHRSMEGYTMMKVVKRIKWLKRDLNSLNVEHFRNILTEAEEDRTALHKIQLQLQANPTNAELQHKERAQYSEFKRSSYLAEIFFQQRSKAT
ncbi:uncharacterized protein LOC132631444 [Lycium barbarum]|uniref:uncharacterized protein LOC132631444 n=1 Tax=Lycium barbarum TaxID=112863 RepID=UPI00293E80AA|nr:uncharacterized protein LOC132631444 [Lycium barbarum]